jgi:hypothetical protein
VGLNYGFLGAVLPIASVGGLARFENPTALFQLCFVLFLTHFSTLPRLQLLDQQLQKRLCLSLALTTYVCFSGAGGVSYPLRG